MIVASVKYTTIALTHQCSSSKIKNHKCIKNERGDTLCSYSINWPRIRITIKKNIPNEFKGIEQLTARSCA